MSHLKLRHRCDYEVLADFGTDEEVSLRAVLEASAQGPCKGGVGDGGEGEDAIMAMVLRESALEAGLNDCAVDSFPRFDASDDEVLAQVLRESAEDAAQLEVGVHAAPSPRDAAHLMAASTEKPTAEQLARQREARLARFAS